MNFSGGKLWSDQLEEDSDEAEFPNDNENDDEEIDEEEQGEEEQSVNDKNEQLNLMKDPKNN